MKKGKTDKTPVALFVYNRKDHLRSNEEIKDEDIMNNRETLSSIYSSSKLLDRIITINTTLMYAI